MSIAAACVARDEGPAAIAAVPESDWPPPDDYPEEVRQSAQTMIGRSA